MRGGSLGDPALEDALDDAPDAVTRGASAKGGVRARGEVIAGERWIARVLRTGAVLSGGLFLSSLALELLPASQGTSVAIDSLRKAGASLLLVTPVARLAVAGVALGLRGEWRYTLYAAGVLGLLALAVGAGVAA
nr:MULTISPECIES: hypothetical protein [Myxococcaceae]